MNINTIRTTMLLILTLSIAGPVTGYNSSPSGDLDGTSWQLVKFEGSEGTMLVPASDRSKYTIAFGANGRATVRVDCNRGSGGWHAFGLVSVLMKSIPSYGWRRGKSMR